MSDILLISVARIIIRRIRIKKLTKTRTGYIFASEYKVIQWLLLDHIIVCVAAAAAAAAAAAVKSFINNATDEYVCARNHRMNNDY